MRLRLRLRLRLVVGLRSAPGGGQIRGAMRDARVEVWVFVLRVRILWRSKGHGSVKLEHSRAGTGDWEEIDGPKRLSVLESTPLLSA